MPPNYSWLCPNVWAVFDAKRKYDYFEAKVFEVDIRTREKSSAVNAEAEENGKWWRQKARGSSSKYFSNSLWNCRNYFGMWIRGHILLVLRAHVRTLYTHSFFRLIQQAAQRQDDAFLYLKKLTKLLGETLRPTHCCSFASPTKHFKILEPQKSFTQGCEARQNSLVGRFWGSKDVKGSVKCFKVWCCCFFFFFFFFSSANNFIATLMLFCCLDVPLCDSAIKVRVMSDSYWSVRRQKHHQQLP